MLVVEQSLRAPCASNSCYQRALLSSQHPPALLSLTAMVLGLTSPVACPQGLSLVTSAPFNPDEHPCQNTLVSVPWASVL